MTAKKKMLEKCLEAFQNNDPTLMDDKVVRIELECGTVIVLDIKYIKEKKLSLVEAG